ncbi:hypothetical protein [Aliamphritea spongicola]|nr:hypothetical protein [Aliamphritea spongicola]
MDAKTVSRLLFTAATLLTATLPAYSFAHGADVSCEAEDSHHSCTLELDEISPANLSIEVMSLDLYRLSKTSSNSKGNLTLLPRNKSISCSLMPDPAMYSMLVRTTLQRTEF